MRNFSISIWLQYFFFHFSSMGRRKMTSWLYEGSRFVTTVLAYARWGCQIIFKIAWNHLHLYTYLNLWSLFINSIAHLHTINIMQFQLHHSDFDELKIALQKGPLQISSKFSFLFVLRSEFHVSSYLSLDVH